MGDHLGTRVVAGSNVRYWRMRSAGATGFGTFRPAEIGVPGSRKGSPSYRSRRMTGRLG